MGALFNRTKRCASHKKKYYDKASASYRANEDSVKSGEVIRAYKCKMCGWWHVGHKFNKGARLENGKTNISN